MDAKATSHQVHDLLAFEARYRPRGSHPDERDYRERWSSRPCP